VTQPKGTLVGPIFAFSEQHRAVVRFYREIVGLVGDTVDDATWLEAANAKLVVREPEQRQTEPEVSRQRGFVVWFGVDDVHAAWARAKAAGVTVGQFRGDYFFARDPDGRYIGFYPKHEHGADHVHGEDHAHGEHDHHG
jgi:predicted enzyme related to lactoylglutathione lyase